MRTMPPRMRRRRLIVRQIVPSRRMQLEKKNGVLHPNTTPTCPTLAATNAHHRLALADSLPVATDSCSVPTPTGPTNPPPLPILFTHR